jgi:transposase
MVINGIFFRTRTGCPWRDVPEGFGNWKTVYNRHRRWSGDGTWLEILDRLRAYCDEAEGRDWTLSADSTVVRAYQQAAGARRARPADLVTGAEANDNNPPAGPGREALGRSRGGLSAKIHLAADRRCPRWPGSSAPASSVTAGGSSRCCRPSASPAGAGTAPAPARRRAGR